MSLDHETGELRVLVCRAGPENEGLAEVFARADDGRPDGLAEPGAQTLADTIAGGAATSAVNLSEVATVLVRHRLDPDKILAPLREQLAAEPFTEADALAASGLCPKTATQGLSLGDRACLPLAQRLGSPAATADQAWAELDLDIAVEVIRPRGS